MSLGAKKGIIGEISVQGNLAEKGMTKQVYFKPYRKEAIDLEYNRLFCDDPALYRNETERFAGDNWKIVLSLRPKPEAVGLIAQQNDLPARLRILAFNYLAKKGKAPQSKELLGVILEAGVDDGLETLAAYTDYQVDYIDSHGDMRHWETAEMGLRQRMVSYFISAAALVEQLRPSDKPRFPPTFAGMARITLLVSDGRYFGQGPSNNLTKDELSGPIIRQANNLLANLMAKDK
jgi:hypothetical protein